MHGDLSSDLAKPANKGPAKHLGLHEKPDAPPQNDAQQHRIKPAQMVGNYQQWSFLRHMLTTTYRVTAGKMRYQPEQSAKHGVKKCATLHTRTHNAPGRILAS